MIGDVAISAEALGKKYVIGHASQRGPKTYRDAISEAARGLSRSVANVARGRPIIAGETTEDFWALKDVNFEVERGEVLGVIGRNGAGKSTLLKILSRITEPTEGRVKLRGRVASLLEVGTGFHQELTGRENIFLNGAILGMTRLEIQRKFDEIVDFAGVDRFLDTPVKRYSSGMYVRLAFAVAAHLDPEILIVDEVLAVGDAAFQKKCLGKMGDVATRDGRTVLFVSHNLAAVQRLCPRSLMLSDGRMVADGPSEAVVGQYVSQTAEPTRICLDERNDRLGTGLVRFTSVKLKDPDGIELKSFRSGSSAAIVLNFENRSGGDLEDVVVALGVDDALGQRITLFSSESSVTGPISVPRDVSAIELAIDRMPFLPGRYGFTLYFAVSGNPADWIQNAGYFDVESGDYYRTGKLSQGQGHFLVDHRFGLVRTSPTRPAQVATGQ